MELSRRDQILKLIVEYFVKKAVPVGSQTLIDEFAIPYSSATIRAEMNSLEIDGLIEKTHTSSGRVPSSAGYRYYVEHLREHGVDDQVKMQLQTILADKHKSMANVINESVQILAHMTNLASVVLGPSARDEHLVSIQVIPLNDTLATAIFVTDQGYVENKTFVVPPATSIKEVKDCVVILNKRLVGTPIDQVVDKMEALAPILTDYVIEHQVIFQAFADAFLRYARERLELFGKRDLLDQPEYRDDASKIKKLLSLLDNPEELARLAQGDEEINIKIGNPEQDKDLSVISATVNLGNNKRGQIAVVGPTRMDYGKVVSTLEYVVHELEEYFQTNSDE
ncbi:MAG: heat-inducible transcriptional repressor HrcA [Bacilli bacterium]|jgi:heat-inducible transcriptional repressor|nr:heat-inducible transcriptional repressor HrcA [Bacilli bacterium]MDD4344663.1 heat-inducible transcriptional repressor HrcA [Bacilli bacterium]MDD4520563.1 heat-inducible transcriptional repressor HrcA [Bacilli bacterium]MDY0399255.1 heat-inducible transcriptional repressor HrcA [Bacilli bacterium]HKM11258.1 heat-inducible transcriptional repressor HrcA [Bacilli bacterium]